MLAVPTPRVIPWTDLFLALFGVPLIIVAFEAFTRGADHTNLELVGRELLILAFTAWFAWRVYRRDGNSLSGVGLHGRHWGRSIGIAIVLALLMLAVLFGVMSLLQAIGMPFGNNEEAARFAAIHPAVIFLMVLRAGIAEEFFYRGYLMETLYRVRPQALVYFLFPLVVFALWHYRQGWAGILISLVAGAIMAIYYWRRRDLKSNMIAHFLVDFIPNIVLPLLAPQGA